MGSTIADAETLLKKGSTDEKGEQEKAISVLLKSVVDIYEGQDKQERSFRVREWKELELMFRGFQRLIYDEVSKDFVTPEGLLKRAQEEGINPKIYDRVVNIYKAHLESIIAAVTSAYPTTRFFPEDAEEPLDITTAKEYSKIAEKLERDNTMKLQFIYAMFLMFNQGVVFAYNYNHASKEYGTYSEPIYKNEDVETIEYACEWCGSPLVDNSPQVCENCNEKTTEPVEMPVQAQEEVLSGYNEVEKTRECIEFYGPLHVKVPFAVKKLADSPYLILYSEQSRALMMEMFPDFADKFSGGAESSEYDRWARSISRYHDANKDVCTLRKVWLRPYALNLADAQHKELIKKLKQEFPTGILVTFVDDQLVEFTGSNLDDHWTATEYPLSSHLHTEPLGKPLKFIQKLENELVSIIMETIFHGIPEGFADPTYFDFKAYGKSSASPGSWFPAKKPVQGNLDSIFYRHQPATLSKEIGDFLGYLQERAQFVLGAFPSIFGGTQKGGSETFSEYEMSRNMAMQRLSIVWKTVTEWIPKYTLKATKSYHQNMVSDSDHFVKGEGANLQNVTIDRTRMLGGVGVAVAETSEQFPVSWPQLRGMLLELLGMKNPQIDGAIMHPENIGFVTKVLGFGGFHIPGKEDRDKQLKEIKKLLEGQPFQETPPPVIGEFDEQVQPPPVDLPSVQIDPDVDLHPIHAATIQAWAVSEEGQEAKEENPAGYQNVILHMKQHIQMIQQQQTAQAPPTGPGGNPPNPQGNGMEAPENLEA